MVRAHGPLSGPGLRLLGYGTAEALTAIHSAGVVHRDLKPGNVMLSDDRPMVIDFGIAQFGDSTRLTQTGLVMGTPGYLAPEVIEGQPSSPASDVHSWGATMAFAATGRSPYGTGSYEEIFFRIVSGRADLAGVPAPLVPLLYAALARDPARRPSATSLSAQSIALDMSAVSPNPVTVGPRPIAVLSAPNPPGSRSPQNPRNGQRPNKARKGRPLQKKLRAPYPPPGQAYPGPKQAAKDVADLMPPVGHAPPAGRAPYAPPAGHAPYAPPAGHAPFPRAAAGPGAPGALRSRDSAAPGSQGLRSRNTMAGLALMVSAVALTVVLPVAGLVVSLAAITLLRAADRAQSTLAARRSVRGPRASDPLVVVITAPVTVVKALLAEALMAPLAFTAAALTYLAALALTHGRSLPQAGAYAAAAVVVWYGVGPGSHRPRRQVNRMAGAVSRTRTSAAATTLAVWALAASAVLFAVSQAPYYWPVMTPHLPALHGWPFMPPRLPRLHALVSSAANWLFVYARA
jgi:Protein kinase domain